MNKIIKMNFFTSRISVFLVIYCLSGIRGDNFLALGDWGGSPLPPYSTLIERSTATQMAATADEQKSKFVLALG